MGEDHDVVVEHLLCLQALLGSILTVSRQGGESCLKPWTAAARWTSGLIGCKTRSCVPCLLQNQEGDSGTSTGVLLLETFSRRSLSPLLYSTRYLGWDPTSEECEGISEQGFQSSLISFPHMRMKDFKNFLPLGRSQPFLCILRLVGLSAK